jgi:uncharacterized protein YwqG
MDSSYLFVFLGFIGVLFLNHLFQKSRSRKEALAAPRITLAETQAYWDAVDQAALPKAKIEVQNREPASPHESRIGGRPLAIGADPAWPLSAKDGAPLHLIAQINFAELPETPDFPNRGILQIFSSFDMLDASGACERVIRWDPDPDTDALLPLPKELTQQTQHDFLSDKARRRGLPIAFHADMAPANPYNRDFEECDLLYGNRLPESQKVKQILDQWEHRCDAIVEGYGTHWLGGHPNFIQSDIRSESPENARLDRVVLHLGFDTDIRLGDGGEMNVLISRGALLVRDFDKIFLTWDCS